MQTPSDPSDYIWQYGILSLNTQSGHFTYGTNKPIQMNSSQNPYKIMYMLFQLSGNEVLYPLLAEKINEPYITEQELIKQLVELLPRIKISMSYLMQEFEVEIKRLQHLKATVLDEYTPRIEMTPHNSKEEKLDNYDESKHEMLSDYLLHVLQYGTPEERVKILKGVNSKFILADRQLSLQ